MDMLSEVHALLILYSYLNLFKHFSLFHSGPALQKEPGDCFKLFTNNNLLLMDVTVQVEKLCLRLSSFREIFFLKKDFF